MYVYLCSFISVNFLVSDHCTHRLNNTPNIIELFACLRSWLLCFSWLLKYSKQEIGSEVLHSPSPPLSAL